MPGPAGAQRAPVSYTHLDVYKRQLFGPPCLAALGLGVVVWGMDALLLESLGPKAVALLGVTAGAVVYGVLLLLTGAIGKEELAYLPGGSKLKRFIRDKRGKHQA